MVRILETDVLVVGGGAAAAYAARKFHEKGIKVLVLVKGFVGRSGCTIFAGNLIVALPKEAIDTSKTRPRDERQAFETWVKRTFYLGDQDYLKDYVQFVKKWLAEMEELGLYIRRMEDGTLATNYPESNSTWAPVVGLSGRNVGDLLRKWVFHDGIRVREEVMVTSILTKDGRAVGATALDYKTGDFFAVKAKAVVLATGLADYLALRSTGTREQCANGRIMAYRVGAELYNLEIQLWHTSDIAWPRAWMRLHNYPNPMPATSKTTRLVNSDGEVFFEQSSMFPWNDAPYHLQLRRLIKEIGKRKAKLDGGYFTSYRHMDIPLLKEHSYQTQFFDKIGIDISRQDVECAVTWHQNFGGVRSNPTTMATATPGLYVAGGITGRPNISGACYTSFIAFRTIEASLNQVETPIVDEGQIEAEQQRIEGFLTTNGDGPTSTQVKRMIRQVMWEKLGPIKNERAMLEGIRSLDRIRSDVIPKMRLTTDTKQWNYELVDAVDAVDMLDYCRLQFHCSLMRKESRGPFYREDYPYVDNENWLKHTIVRLRDSKMDLFTVDVDLKYVSPERKKLDYFSADY